MKNIRTIGAFKLYLAIFGDSTYNKYTDAVRQQLETLPERDQKVLTLRFGLNGGRSRTLEEVGQEFQLTRERIRQIEGRALRRLRHPSRSGPIRTAMRDYFGSEH